MSVDLFEVANEEIPSAKQNRTRDFLRPSKSLLFCRLGWPDPYLGT